jgi:hypothetical protein
MGMFDTLVDGEYESQVKIFYHPMYSPTFGIDHSGGMLDVYNRGDDVPIETMYYRYPRNFYIYLDDDYLPFAVIRDGKFDGFLFNVDDATEFSDYYTYRGEKIRAKCLDDMKDYIAAEKAEWAKSVESRNFIRFGEEWHEPISLEHQLGELVECWGFLMRYISSDVYEEFKKLGFDHRRDYIEVTQLINEFRAEHPDVFDEFMRKWNIEWDD